MDTADRMNKALEKFNFLKEQGVENIPISRLGEVDIAYPASEEEYCALGGYAVVMIVAISDDREELPIERAYFQIADKKTVPLENLGVRYNGGDLLAGVVKEKQDHTGRICFENVSFWYIPVAWFKFDDSFIAIDYKGERKKFIIHRGPWKLDIRVQTWISKHIGEQKIAVAQHVPFEVIANFIDREFLKNNRIKL